MAKLWFSLYDRGEYTGPEQAFYKTAEIDFTKVIEENYEIIKAEFFTYVSSHQLKSYFNASMVEKKNSWKTVSLKSWNVNIYENWKFFPQTLSIINSIDGLVSASFNKLEPQAKIKPHCGDTNGIFRCHLSLYNPGSLPLSGFRVKNEWRNWEDGKLLVFVDANNHEAINMTNEDRFIFLFDVIRPEFRHQKNFICSTVLSSLFLQKRAENASVLYKAPLFAQIAVGRLLVPFAFVASGVRNFLYKRIKH